MITLRADDWFNITGRDQIATVDMRQIDGCPDPMRTDEDIPVKVGDHVLITYKEFEVIGIECAKVLTNPPSILPNVGLVVRPTWACRHCSGEEN